MPYSNVPVRNLTMTSEARMIDEQVDAYAAGLARDISSDFCTVITTDGSHVKLRYNTTVVNFKTSKREDDVEFTDLSGSKLVEAPVYFNHVGLKVGISSLEDSNGDGIDQMARYGRAVGGAAGTHTTKEILRILLSNPKTVWDNRALFANNHVADNGETFSNDFVGDPTSGTVDDLRALIDSVLQNIQKIPNAAGFALATGPITIYGSAAHTLRIRNLLFGGQVNGTDYAQAFSIGNVSFKTLPDLARLGATPTEKSKQERSLYIVAKSLVDEGAMVHVQREGLTTQIFGQDNTDAQLYRMRQLQYISRFRDSVLPHNPAYIARIRPAT